MKKNRMETGFKHNKSCGVVYLTIPAFERAGGVCCAFSTRIGGVSPAPYDTLNFSHKRENSSKNFSENMRRFADAARFDSSLAVSINYAHGADLCCVTHKDAGCGISREPLSQKCDGLYTAAADLPLISSHADCVPLFFYDPKGRAAAVCHAGWRGTAAHMTKKAVDALVGLGCSAGDILAAVGPCISAEHFEVGEDVRDVFLRAFGRQTVFEREKRLYIDLNKACILDMLQAGIVPKNITDAALCTYGNAALFFSHRRDKGKTGAMAAVIALK